MEPLKHPAEASLEQPIWVQDLLAWLETIQPQNLTGEEWVRRVEEVLAELPGQGLPEEFWPKKAAETEAEVAVPESAASELPRLSDEDRARIQAELERLPTIKDESPRSSALAAVAAQIPASEPQLLQQALEIVKDITDGGPYRFWPLVAVAAQIPASEPQLLKVALEIVKDLKDSSACSKALAAVAAQIPASEPPLLKDALEIVKGISEYWRFDALAAVAAQIPASESQLLQDALKVAKDFKNEDHRFQALAAVVAQIPASERQTELKDALKAAKDIESESYRSKALAAVAAQIPASESQLLQDALNAAKGIKNESYCSKALAAVAAQIPASESQLLQDALKVAQGIKDESSRYQALAAVAAQIPASENQLLKDALEAANDIENEEPRTRALTAVVAQLPASEPQLLKDALQAANDIKDEKYRSWALEAVVAQLPASEPQLLKDALEIIKDLKDESYRSLALVAVVAQIPASETQLLKDALEAAKDIKDASYRSKALAAVATQITISEHQSVLQDALKAAKGIENESYRSPALAAVAAQIPASETQLLQEALEAAQDIKDASYRSKALAAVAPQLSASERQSVLQDALQAAADIQAESSQVQALTAVVAQIPASESPLLKVALKIAKDFKNEDYRFQSLAAVAAKLHTSETQLLKDALEATTSFTKNELYRFQALAAVVAQIPPNETKLLEDALVAATNIKDATNITNQLYRFQVLAAVAAKLPDNETQLLKNVLEAAKNIQSEGVVESTSKPIPISTIKRSVHISQSRTLALVAAKFSDDERQPVILDVLKTANNIEDKYYQSLALTAVAAQLSDDERPPVLQDALDVAKDIKDESSRTKALVAVAAQLSDDECPPVLQDALDAAKDIKDESSRTEALVAVAAQLSDDERPPVLQDALEAAKNIENEYYCSTALAAVAAQIPASEPQLLQQVLNVADYIEDESSQSQSLGAVVAHLLASEPQLLQQALTAAQTIGNEEHRSVVLAAVAAHLPASEPQLLQQFIQIVSAIETPEHRVTALRDPAFRITGALLLHTPQTLLATLLRVVPQGPTTADRARLLSALAPKLSPGLFPRALQLVHTEISHPDYRAEILANLAPYLPPYLLTEAFDIVQHHIPGYSYPTTALCALIPHLSLIQIQAALDIASERIPQPPLTSKIFQAVATRLSNASRSRLTPEDLAQKNHRVQDVLSHIQHHSHDEKSIANILSALAPSLDGDSLNAVLANILPKLPSEFYRAQVLAALATAPQLTTQQLIPCREKAMELSQAYPKTTALSALMPHFPELHQDVAQLQADAPNAIQKIDLALILATRPHTDDAAYLSRLTTDQTDTLRLIRDQSRDPDKANSLVKLAPHLRQDLLLEAQSVAQDIQDRYHQARSLLALATHFPEVRANALTQINSLQNSDPVQQIELLSQYTITVPEQIPPLLKAIEAWAKENPFKEDPKAPDANTFKRRRILIALKPHLPLRLGREIDRETDIGKASQSLWERALFLLRTGYRQALKSGTLRNDATQDTDLLNLKEEINALTEMLMMRDLDPPVAVGILGGWGGGKSYIMHLMQTHMVKIRSQGIDPIEAWGLTEGRNTPDNDRVGRFVGHIYQIKFDAWTYAKADLWASLMQTIFFELDRQISLETALREIGIDPLDSNSSEIWRVLYQTNEDDCQYLLEKTLGKEKLSELKEKNKEQQESWTTLLWEQYGIAETDARNRLAKAEEQLDQITHQLKKLEQEKITLNERIAPDKEPGNWFTGVLIETSSISGFLFSKYFGAEIARGLQTEIENRLKSTDVDSSDLNKINLFINQTFSEILDEDQIILPNGDKKYSLSWFALRKWANKNRQLIITVLILLGCAILGPLIVHWINPKNTIAQLSWLITPLIPAISLIQNLFKSHQKWLAQAQRSIQDYQVTLQERAENKFHNLISENQAIELRKLDGDINKLRNQQKNLEQEITQAQNDLPPDKFASLASFVNATVKGERYDRELGMMHKVKIDLSKLSQALLPPPHDSEEYKNKLNKLRDVFPRGPARVVLFIDDLDRCPPDTVVDVLEAVQLLVKNPLFIAVLAIDERYINRALAKHYQGVLSLQGRPSAADYLEKIIQIPYRIRPIDETALRNYLRAQVVIQDSETSGTKFNEFCIQEFNLLVQCCQESELSPRSLKRLTNVYKLYKVLSRTRGHRPTRREQKAILALLAFSSRYPDLMRDIIEEIGSHYEEGRHLLGQNEKAETLTKVINTYLDKYERLNPNSALIQDIKKLRHDVKKLVDDDLELKEIRQIFDFVRSFSFVGDIGTDYTPSSIFSQTSTNFLENV